MGCTSRKQFTNNEGVHICDLRPAYESLLSLISSLSDDTRIAPLAKLTELYNRTFSPRLKNVLGTALNEDLDALASLRNLFAHGRDFFLEFEGEDPEYASLDSNPIQKPALRLHRAGIIKNLKITGRDHPDFKAAFYGDAALLYFYHAVEQIQEKLTKNINYLPESQGMPFTKLPKLEEGVQPTAVALDGSPSA